MTFEDDFVRLVLPTGEYLILPCPTIGFEWPPPDHIKVLIGQSVRVMHRTSMSEITDEQRADMTNVCRGAEYTLPNPENN